MKKILLIFMLFSALNVFGCGQKQKDSASESTIDEGITVQHDYPTVCMPPWEQAMPVSKNGIYGKGQAQGEQRLAQNRDLADRRAREAIGARLESRLPDAITTFIQRNHNVSNIGSSDFATELSYKVLMQPLNGSYVAERYMCPDGTVYSLAFFPFANFSKKIVAIGMEEAKKSTKNKKFYDVFASKKSVKNLKRLLKREFID